VRHCPRPQNLPTNEDIWDAVAAATPEPDQFQDKVQDRVLSGLTRKAGIEECVLSDRFLSSKFAAVSIIAEQLPVGEKMIVFVSNSSGASQHRGRLTGTARVVHVYLGTR
jgi:hypothetical protein